MRIRRHAASTATAMGLLAALVIAAPASAGVKNGNFESGSLSGWKAQADSASPEPGAEPIAEWRAYSESTRVLPDCDNPMDPPPCLGGATLPRPIGKYASAFVQEGPSNGSLSQNFRVGPRARYLTLRVFWINQAGGPGPGPESMRGLGSGWAFAGTFDISPSGGADNQYFSIDLVRRNASPLTTEEGDILAEGFAPNSATDLDSGGWQAVKIPLRKLRGKQVKLRLAAVDNQFFLNVGLDSVRVVNGRKPKPVTG